MMPPRNNPKLKMKIKKYHHAHAGTVSKISGIVLKADGHAEPGSIRLYKIGDQLHLLQTDDTPGGPVAVAATNVVLQGWDLTPPLMEVTSGAGHMIIVEESQIKAVG